MRISDWSSDVCSSDLYRSGNRSDDVQGLYNIISRMYQIGFKLPAANRGSGFAPRHHIALPLMVADQGLHPIDGAQRLLRQHLGRAAIRGETTLRQQQQPVAKEIGRAHV